MIKEILDQNKGRNGVRRVHRELLNRSDQVNHTFYKEFNNG